MSKFFRTIQEMAAWYYNEANIPAINAEMMKADAPIQIGTTGVRNVVFGAKLHSQLVNSMNTFGLLEKRPWEKGGYRAITAAATTVKGGTSESGAIGDTVKPTFQEITVPPKLTHTPYEESSLQNAIEPTQDDTIKWADVVAYMHVEFANMINRCLNTDNDTLASSNIESIDRIIGSYAEINAGPQGGNDLDIHGLDRDGGASWADAYVSHGSQTDRTLTLSLLDAVLTNIRPYWDSSKGNSNKVMTTGNDTLERMQQLLVAQQRFTAPVSAKVGVNGIETLVGAEAGFNIATYQNIPVFPENEMQQDTLSRVYVIDKDNLFFAMLTPPQHLETRGAQDYILLDAFNTRALDYLQGEVTCVKFKAQGKLRDIK